MKYTTLLFFAIPSHPMPPSLLLTTVSSSSFTLLPHSLKLINCHSSSSSSNPSQPTGAGDRVKIPAAPWTRGPVYLPSSDVIDFSRLRRKKQDSGRVDQDDNSLTGGVRGGRSRKAMREIIRNINKLRDNKDGFEEMEEDFEFIDRLEGAIANGGDGDLQKMKMPWAKGEGKMRMVFPREKKERVATMAEAVLSTEDLRRLRSEARGIRKWVRAKKAGITQEVVDEIRRMWRSVELAMVKVVEPLSRNMDRAREIAETKTGGLVVWCRKDKLVIYRGNDYQCGRHSTFDVEEATSLSKCNSHKSHDHKYTFPLKHDETTSGSAFQSDLEKENSSSLDFELLGDIELVNGTLYEREANRLLDGLGPRFIDWWWKKPLPVDADLLAEVVPGFRPPFRRCPPGMKSKLKDNEITYLRKLAQPLPTHFALGKNTKLQGLAAAIIKLWEKCPIAKIAVKVGLENSSNQQMSLELKRLTGGILILRNKFFILLYRGKDFLPVAVENSIFEREKELDHYHLLEEEARLNTVREYHVNEESKSLPSEVGSFTEFHDIQANYCSLKSKFSEEQVEVEAEKLNLEKQIKEQERRLFILNAKIEKSEKVLTKITSSWNPSTQNADQELLTDEERQTLRNIGLKMDEFLLLGRRGIYDGVIGSIHQHWKHREVVKVITMQKAVLQVNYTARLLEIESGGVLVAVEKTRKGHAIIIYRGKNYSHPLKLLPENLLTKREALQRSIEIQRRGSLKFFASQKKQAVWELKKRLNYLEERSRKFLLKESHNLQKPSMTER